MDLYKIDFKISQKLIFYNDFNVFKCFYNLQMFSRVYQFSEYNILIFFCNIK